MPKAKLKNKCKAAVEKNADFIVDLLIKEVTPKEVCLALGFCFTQHNNNQDIVQVVNLPVEKPTPNEYVCRLCQVVVKKVEDELNNKTAQEDVEKCLQEVCVTLPNSLRPKCKKFIDAYANEIIKHIPNDSPKDVCTKACVCNAADEEYSAEPELIGKWLDFDFHLKKTNCFSCAMGFFPLQMISPTAPNALCANKSLKKSKAKSSMINQR